MHARIAELEALATEGDVPVAVIGRVGGSRIRLAIAGHEVIDEPLADAERIWASAIGQYFESQRAIA